ncbi:MAG TPA: response regulator [Thermoanaerobaculia bacterium]|jgi:CheY-like chemotaxis protein|nr:response regulator [Thermoanaerobaculia bacterium]
MDILIIEDDPIDRKLVGVVLTTSGHVVHARTSAEEAIEAIATYRPDLILLDLKLPGMSGLELLRKLKSLPDYRDLPVAVVTAFPELFRKDALVEAGCDAFLVKPINTRTLAQQVVEIAARKSEPD